MNDCQRLREAKAITWRSHCAFSQRSALCSFGGMCVCVSLSESSGPVRGPRPTNLNDRIMAPARQAHDRGDERIGGLCGDSGEGAADVQGGATRPPAPSLQPVRRRGAGRRVTRWLARLVCVLASRGGAAKAADRDCSTSPAGAKALTETACPPRRPNLNPDVRYFKVTVGAGGADSVYTSLISPSNATCSGTQGSHICSAPLDNIVTYKAFSGQGCVPDESNNNWADLSARFSKSVVVCKPCDPGDYWVGIIHHSPSAMGCDFIMFTPKISSSDAAASCTFDPVPANAVVEATDTCAAGLVRVKEVGCPFQHTCLLDNCINMCVFGYCQDVFFLGASALAGLLLCGLFSCCVLCICRRSWKRKLKKVEDDMRDMASKPYGVSVVDDGADSDQDDFVPDLLPPTFFVRDRDD